MILLLSFSYTHLCHPAHSVPRNGKILNLLFIAYYLLTNYSLVYNIIRILPAINSLTVTQLPSNYPHPRGHTYSFCVIGNWLFFISIIFHLADPYDRRKVDISPCCEEIILQSSLSPLFIQRFTTLLHELVYYYCHTHHTDSKAQKFTSTFFHPLLNVSASSTSAYRTISDNIISIVCLTQYANI